VITLGQDLDRPFESVSLKRVQRSQNARLIDQDSTFDIGYVDHQRFSARKTFGISSLRG
jgi:hypothetical protein